MPNTIEVKEMINLFKKRVKGEIKLGKQIGTGSAYGAVFEIVGQPKKVVKIFKSRRLSLARREAYISISLGWEGIGPKVYKAGMVGLEPRNYVVYTIMDKIDGDIYSLKKTKPKLYRKHKKEIEKEVIRLIENMHKKKFVHADLKEDNLAYKIVKGKIELYIIDFGFSSLMPFDIKTNKNLAKAIIIAYKQANFDYQNLVNANAIHKVQRRYDDELLKNKMLKITMKRGININTLYKKLNKTKFEKQFVSLGPKNPTNAYGPGVFRYKLANEHWIIYHPVELIRHERQGKGEYLRNRLSN